MIVKVRNGKVVETVAEDRDRQWKERHPGEIHPAWQAFWEKIFEASQKLDALKTNEGHDDAS